MTVAVVLAPSSTPLESTFGSPVIEDQFAVAGATTQAILLWTLIKRCVAGRVSNSMGTNSLPSSANRQYLCTGLRAPFNQHLPPFA